MNVLVSTLNDFKAPFPLVYISFLHLKILPGVRDILAKVLIDIITLLPFELFSNGKIQNG